MVGRGEDAGFPKCYHHFLLFPKYYHQFLLLPQCFQKDFTCRSSKVLFVRLRVNPIPRNPELEKVFKNIEGKGKNETEEKLNLYELLVVLGFNATLTAKVISWRSMTHMCFLAFSHQYLLFFPKPPTTFPTCFCRGERRKYAGKKSRLNRGSNSQPPGHESDTLTTEPPARNLYEC